MGNGEDHLMAFFGPVEADLGDGDDRYSGLELARSKVWGGPGNDYFSGGYWEDEWHGGTGDDFLNARWSSGKDYLYGDDGDDR